MSRFDAVWRSLDEQVAAGWAPGIVAGIRHEAETEFYATGTLAFGVDEPMTTATPFRVASLSKPIGGVIALSMVADGLFALDDPVARWLPELAEPRVLVSPDAPLDQTAPADRAITVRDLLTLTHGQGQSFQETPFSAALEAIGAGPIPLQISADEYLAEVAALPLAYQPGTRWMYHTGSDLLSILIARVAGKPLQQVLTERLGLEATRFWADGRTMPTAYRPTPQGPQVFDEYTDGFAEPPGFASFGGGLVSTVEDQLAFLAALADGKLIPDGLRDQMTSDQLTPQAREGIPEMTGPGRSWGFQVAVDTAVTDPWTAPGRYGWTGGAGTSAYTDPSRDLIGVVLSQRFMSGPRENFSYFWEPLAAVV